MISTRFPNLILSLLSRTLILLLIFCATFNHLKAQDEPLNVFDAYQGYPENWIKYRHLDEAWYNHLHQLADAYLDYRKEWIASCTTKVAWNARKQSLTQRLKQSIGPFPEKTPLRAKVVETLDRPDFIVEKLIYESLPEYYVTAALFLPKQRQPKAPAVIYCSGHTELGFRSDTYQRVIINLVEKGFIVLAFDPIGQGERFQYLDEQGTPNMGGTTREHSYAGALCLINGTSIAKYMIYDGIRAVDYLLSRPEVDPDRIGITGRSGGGTQSAYIAAYDDRIYAVAPENYITSFQRIWESIGPQDGEQNLPSANLLEIDHADLLEVRVPKPALMLTTTRDFFSIQGAKETYQEVKRIYSLFDEKDPIQFAEDDYGHGSTKANREALYAFFQKHLKLPGNSSDQEVALFTVEDLTLTETGQVATALDSKTIFDLNLENNKKAPTVQKEDLMNRDSMNSVVLGTLGASPFPDTPKAVFTGRVVREGYQIEKYFLEFENGHYPIPFLWVSSEANTKSPLAIYLSSEGKQSGINRGGEIEQLINKGYKVMAVDLLNTGELHTQGFRGDSYMKEVSYNLVYGSDLVGKSLTALQVEDLYHVMEFALQQDMIDRNRITAIADQQTCIPLMVYVATNPTVQQVVLRNPLASWESLIHTRLYEPKFTYSIVPGAFHSFDLPVLAAMIAPGQLNIFNPLNANGKGLSQEEWEETYMLARSVYENNGKAMNFSIERGGDWLGKIK